MMAEASSVVASASAGGADDGVVLVLDAASLTLPSSERQNPRRALGKKHLPKEAYNILKDYFFNVNQFPKKRDRLELAAKVNSVPGCEGYTQENVSGYFANLRKRHRQTSTVVVKRELVEDPLSVGADASATNGTTSVVNQHTESCSAPLPSISTAGAESSISGYLASTGSRGSVSALNPSSRKTQKKRTRLKAEGYKILHDFFNTVSRYPTAAQKAELLAVVTAMEGCEGYTLATLTAYFSRMRIERKGAVSLVKAESPDPQSNGALYPEQGPPSAASLVLRPEPEPEPVPELEPLLATTRSSPILRLAPSVPQPLPPSPQPASGSQLNVFSIYEPVTSILAAPLHPQVSVPAAPLPLQINPRAQPHTNPRTNGSGPQAIPRHAQPVPPRHPSSYTAVLHLSSSIDSGAALAGAPAFPESAREAVEDNNNAVGGTSDRDRDPTATPKKKSKPKLKATSTPEQKPQPRALSDAALKMLDDYYTTVTPHPSMAQSQALAAQVSALPGGGGRCTAKQVRKYFKKRRGEAGARCEALTVERMGADAGVGVEGPRMVRGAVVEPRAGVTFDQPVLEMSNVDPVASDLSSARASSPPPALNGGEIEQVGDQAVPDVLMDDVLEKHEPEAVVPGSPKPDHDGERSDVHAQVPAEEERMDPGLEFDGDVENAEPCPEVSAELDPGFQAQVPAEDAESGREETERGPGLVAGPHQESSSQSGDCLDKVAPPNAGPADLAATSGASPSAEGGGGGGEGSVDEAMLDMPMDDVREGGEPGSMVLASPRSEHGGEFPGVPETEQMDAQSEGDVAPAETDFELVAVVEPDLNLNSGEPVCEVVSDPVHEDLAKPPALLSPALDGTDEDCVGDPSTPEISMYALELNTLPEDDPEEVVPEEEVLDKVVSKEKVSLDVVLSSLQQNEGDADIDTPMDIDSGTPPASVEVDILGLAMQLQRVFSKPPALDGGHPTTFADFATWLETRNVGVVCASS